MRLLRSMPQPGVQTEPKNRSDLHPRKIMSQTSDSIYNVEESPHWLAHGLKLFLLPIFLYPIQQRFSWPTFRSSRSSLFRPLGYARVHVTTSIAYMQEWKTWNNSWSHGKQSRPTNAGQDLWASGSSFCGKGSLSWRTVKHAKRSSGLLQTWRIFHNSQ